MAAKATKSWTPVPYTDYQVQLIQALSRGDATPEMQRDALRFVIETVCGTYDMSYRPESERDTCFAEGRRFVGLTLIKLTKIILDRLKPLKE